MNTVKRNTEKRKFMKRILAVLVAAGLVVGMMPATAQAAGHSHPICGASCSHTQTTHNNVTFEKVLSVTDDGVLAFDGTEAEVHKDPSIGETYVLPAGSYYLDGNLQGLNKPIYIGEDSTVSLCLNGCEIAKGAMGEVIYVEGELFLTDCRQDSGKITHGNSEDGAKYTGCGVHVSRWGTFNMYGGTITGNESNSAYHGGVLVNLGYFNMYGGVISDNSFWKSGGGVVVLRQCVFSMYDGRIANNKSTYDGGGVFVYGGTFNMSGGLITGNTAGDNGGGARLMEGSTFNMYGGSITNNTASGNGGGVFCDDSSSLMQLSGSPTISGNKLASAATSNIVWNSSTKTPTISGELKEGADIHMTMSSEVAAVFASDVPASDMSGYFTCDDPAYEAYYDADAGKIKWKLKATPKVDPTYTAPVGKTGLTYTGSTQELIGAGITNGGEMQYKLGADGAYSTAIPTATKAGTYTVYYKIVGNDSYNDVAEQSLTVEIARTTPAGDPVYTPITEAGKTLVDANLTVPAGWPAGTIGWTRGEIGMPSTTDVTQGTSYHWVFIPSDIDNYTSTGGELVLWKDGGSEHVHTWGAWVSNNNGTHTHTCTENSSHTETVNCSGGTATCTSQAVCSGCNTAYGSVNASNHAGGTEVRNYVAATTEATGYTGDTYCLGCHNIIAAGTTIPKLGSGSEGGNNSGTPSTGGSSTAPASTGSSDTTTSAGGSEEEAPVYENYTVQKGDTLRAIAKKYGCTVDEIVEANSELIKNPNLIRVGWELKIPQKGEAGADNTSGAASQDNTNTGVYIVKKGDTLWGISRKCGCKVADIVALNRDLIADPNKIFAGWELKVPEE